MTDKPKLEVKLNETNDINLQDGDYVLIDGNGWFQIDGFAIRLHRTDEGVIADIWDNAGEQESPIASTYAFTADLEQEEET